ncbi:MAG: hypothetical protein K0Q73_2305 [Paenibacillus sp.]|nr:hypothetical protein [Paenibacillus sp.]
MSEKGWNKDALKLEWTIATEHCHHGIPFSNGVFGALIWF